MKTKLTLEIEKYLQDQCKEKRIYGCEEVTIGFCHNGHGNEAVDFAIMDSMGIIKCYEIKVTVADLKSHAAKSFYGHYNYLIISEQIEDKIDDFSPFIPADVGIKVYDGSGLISIRNAAKREVAQADLIMMKESMIRSMFFKMSKYMDSIDPEKIREEKAKYNEVFRQYKKASDENDRLKKLIRKHEFYQRHVIGNRDYDFEETVENETITNINVKEKHR